MIAGNHHMWSIYGSETAVSETAISQLQNRSKYRILHSILQSQFRAVFVPRVLIFKKLHLLTHSQRLAK